MALPTYAIKNSIPVYKVITFNYLEFIKNQFGRIRLYNSSEKTLDRYSIINLDKFSKKEKNIFADLLQNLPNNQAEEIVKSYNFYYSNRINNIKDITDFLKQINTISIYLKASPYKEQPQFVNFLYSSFIKNEFNSSATNKINFDLLKKAFHLHADINTIKDLFSNDIKIVDSAKKQISESNLLSMRKDTHDLMVNSISGMIALSTVNEVFFQETSNQALKFLEIAGNVSNFLFHDNFVNTHVGGVVAISAVAGASFYGLFSIFNSNLHGLINEVKEKDLLISFSKPSEINNDFFKHSTINKIFYNILTDSDLKEDSIHNKKYLSLMLFLNEKINNPSYIITSELKKYLELDDNQIHNLNSMTINDIHSISNVESNYIRNLLLTNKFSKEESYTLKSLGNIESLLNKNKNDMSIISYPNNDIIKNINKKLSSNEKKIANFYFSLLSKEDLDNFPPIKNKRDFITNMNNYIEKHTNEKEKIFNNSLKNSTLNFIKKIGTLIVGSKELTLNANNPKIKNKLVELSNLHQFNNIDYVLNINKQSNTTENINNVLLKIGKIREKIKSVPEKILRIT